LSLCILINKFIYIFFIDICILIFYLKDYIVIIFQFIIDCKKCIINLLIFILCDTTIFVTYFKWLISLFTHINILKIPVYIRFFSVDPYFIFPLTSYFNNNLKSNSVACGIIFKLETIIINTFTSIFWTLLISLISLSCYFNYMATFFSFSFLAFSNKSSFDLMHNLVNYLF
jgi:hypothetical protein